MLEDVSGVWYSLLKNSLVFYLFVLVIQGGHVPNPSYEEVCRKTTGHTEAVEIIFDPEIISFSKLVEIYWAQTDPTDAFVNLRIVVITIVL